MSFKIHTFCVPLERQNSAYVYFNLTYRVSYSGGWGDLHPA
jgi:hypothetical protein